MISPSWTTILYLHLHQLLKEGVIGKRVLVCCCNRQPLQDFRLWKKQLGGSLMKVQAPVCSLWDQGEQPKERAAHSTGWIGPLLSGPAGPPSPGCQSKVPIYHPHWQSPTFSCLLFEQLEKCIITWCCTPLVCFPCAPAWPPPFRARFVTSRRKQKLFQRKVTGQWIFLPLPQSQWFTLVIMLWSRLVNVKKDPDSYPLTFRKGWNGLSRFVPWPDV